MSNIKDVISLTFHIHGNKKQKISLGQAGKLETKGKKIQSVWHRLTTL